MRYASALALLALAPACSTPRVDITPRYGSFDIDGGVGIATGGVSARADLETAGLRKDDSVFGLRGDFDWGPLHLMASTQASNHDGDGTLTADISAGGVTLPAGTDVSSKLDLGLHTGALTFDFIPTQMFELGLGLGLSYVDFEASFTDSTTGLAVATDEAGPVPLLAARAGVRVWRLDFSLQGSGLSASYDGTDLALLDLDAMAMLRLFGGEEHLAGHLTVGYRYLDLALDYDDGGDAVDADLTFQGPYVGLTVSI